MSPDPSPAVRISRVDVHDDAALAAWHDLVERSERHDHGDLATVWTLPELTAELRSGRRQVSSAAYVGTVEGRPVVWGMTMLPQLDNLATADMGVAVPPEGRRRGYGSAMLRHLEAEATAAGRSVLTSGSTSWRRRPLPGTRATCCGRGPGPCPTTCWRAGPCSPPA